MTVTVCDICGEIIERNVKEPVKGVCLCGKCLGTLAAMVMERNQQEKEAANLEKQDAPVIPAENTAPIVIASGNAEYAEEYFQAFISGKVGIESFIDECAYVGNVIQCFKRTGSFDTFVRAFISKLGITKDDVALYQEQDIEDSNSQDSEDDKEIENSNSQSQEPDKEPPPEHTRKKRTRIDHGRVIVLHNAGWSNWQIAEEVDASCDAINHVLSRARKAGENVMTAEEIAADKKKRNRII